jgi:hypothetical protein
VIEGRYRAAFGLERGQHRPVQRKLIQLILDEVRVGDSDGVLVRQPHLGF